MGTFGLGRCYLPGVEFASQEGKPMKKKLSAKAAVAAVTAATASPAYAWRGGWGWGPGLAAGVVGGAIVGGAIAASPYGPYGYYGPGPYYAGTALQGLASSERRSSKCLKKTAFLDHVVASVYFWLTVLPLF